MGEPQMPSAEELAKQQVEQLDSARPSEHQEKGIEYLDSLLDDNEYQEAYVGVATNPENDKLKQANAAPEKKAQEIIKGLVEEAARQALGEPDLMSAKKRGKEFGQALRSVKSISYNGVDYNMEGGKSPELEALLKEELLPEFSADIESAKRSLEEARSNESARLETIKGDFAKRSNDPEFLAAMEVWGMSPDSKGDRGTDGKGYHAGIVHYFEYRRDLEKAGRFKIEKTPFSVDGYIEDSNMLKELLDNPSEENEAIDRSAFIKDDEGHMRLMILTKDGKRVICFQNPNEPMRVVSIIPGGNVKNFEKMVEKEVHPSGDMEPRLNELGPNRELVA